MSIWFGLFGVPPPPFSSAAPFEALMMMFFLRLFAPSPVGFGTPITTLFVGRLIKVDFDEPMDDDDDTDANKVAAHNPRIFLTRRRPPAVLLLLLLLFVLGGEEKRLMVFWTTLLSKRASLLMMCFCVVGKKARCIFSLRPVLKFAQYDTLNYKTPLKDLFRVSYLGNLRTGLYNEEGKKEGELCAIFFPN